MTSFFANDYLECGGGQTPLWLFVEKTAKAVAPSTFAKPSVDSATALQIAFVKK